MIYINKLKGGGTFPIVGVIPAWTRHTFNAPFIQSVDASDTIAMASKGLRVVRSAGALGDKAPSS